jgi:hypothetical protein
MDPNLWTVAIAAFAGAIAGGFFTFLGGWAQAWYSDVLARRQRVRELFLPVIGATYEIDEGVGVIESLVQSVADERDPWKCIAELQRFCETERARLADLGYYKDARYAEALLHLEVDSRLRSIATSFWVLRTTYDGVLRAVLGRNSLDAQEIGGQCLYMNDQVSRILTDVPDYLKYIDQPAYRQLWSQRPKFLKLAASSSVASQRAKSSS